VTPAGLLCRLLAGAIPAERVRQAADQALAEDGLQRALPTPTPPPDLQLPPEPLVLLVRFLFTAGLAVLVVLAAVWLYRRFRGAGGDRALAGDGAPGAAPLEVPLGDASALAGEGRFGEAIHLLLLETLEALSRAARLSPALTSREIVAGVPLPPPAREALAGLVTAVELSRFGGAEPGQADYLTCLGRFETFLACYREAP
jgi:hypothetical protein